MVLYTSLLHRLDSLESLPCPIAFHATHVPDNLAIVTQEKSLSYRELDRKIQSLVQGLSALGICQEEKVAFTAHPTLETIALFLALLRLSAIACPLSPRLLENQRAE